MAVWSPVYLSLPRTMRSVVGGVIKPFLKDRHIWLNKAFASRFGEMQAPEVQSGKNLLDNFLYLTLFATSVPSLLRFEDRNSMAHSIESRVPFLDYRMAEFLFSTPDEEKIHNGMTKRILRDAMAGVLPESIRNRTDKIGFSTPEDTWFRTTLRPYVENVLSSESFLGRPYFDSVETKELFHSHVNGHRNASAHLWRVVNTELWLRLFID